MAHILIVDDQPAVRDALQLLLELHGLSCLLASSPAEALDLVAKEDIAVVIQDMNFSRDSTSGEEGEALFRSLRQLDAELPILLLTAWTSLETAIRLVKEGATDYLSKPWNDEKVASTVRNLMRMRTLQLEQARTQAQRSLARETLAERANLCGVIYASDAMHTLITLAVNVARAPVPILITGPNGTGKEKLAEIVQANSDRRDKPFIRVNAGALPDELLESELFGAEVGAFTGAQKRRIGRFEAADGGTLFLDEIGNLSPAGQMKLLRVLQTGEFSRLGSSQVIKVDVRILSATNADLRASIRAGTFREDLFFRLNVIEIHLPALCDRPDDILPLAEQFLKRFTAGGPPLTFSRESLRRLSEYEWPGNIRELQNCIQRAALLCTGTQIGPADLKLEAPERMLSSAQALHSVERPPLEGDMEPPSKTTSESMPPEDPESAAERAQLERVLGRSGGVIAKAAAELGLSRQALYRKMERFGLSLERRLKP